MSQPCPEYDDRYLAGIIHFNRGKYFEAHEVWEDLWRECSSTDRRFYQSLIQAAVALHHRRNGNQVGADRLFQSGRRYMEPFRPAHHGLDVDRFWRDMESAFGDGGFVPLIKLDPPPATWSSAAS